MWLLAVVSAIAAAAAAIEPAPPRDLDTIYPGARTLREAASDVICLVDIDPVDDARRHLRDRSPIHHSLERFRTILELDAAGLPCLLVHESMLQESDLQRPTVRAVVVHGAAATNAAAGDERVHRLFRECDRPMLCLGGAYTLGARACGAQLGRPPKAASEPFQTLEATVEDPLFAGVGPGARVRPGRSAGIAEAPPELEILGGDAGAGTQAFRHRHRPIWGVQFQPDRANDANPAGHRVLENFFRSAGIDVDRCRPLSRTSYRERVRDLVRSVCRPPTELRAPLTPCVALVDMEHPDVVGSPSRGSGTGLTHAEKIHQFRTRIEELSGLPCVVVHYAETVEADFGHANLNAVVLTGAGSPAVEPMLRDLYAVIRAAQVPILGVCAGHQHVARAYGAETASMRALRNGEPDPNPRYHPGMFKEWGFLPVNIARPDPLFDGLPGTIVVQQYHMARVSSLPNGFDLLASSSECPIQAIRRRDRPVYGTQFHAECYDDTHPDGRRVLLNFFRIAAAHSGTP